MKFIWIFSVSSVRVLFPCVEQRDAVVVLPVQRRLVARRGGGSAARRRRRRGPRCRRHQQGHGRGKHHLAKLIKYRVNLNVVIERRDCNSEEVLDHCRDTNSGALDIESNVQKCHDLMIAEWQSDLLEVSLPETKLFHSLPLRSCD